MVIEREGVSLTLRLPPGRIGVYLSDRVKQMLVCRASGRPRYLVTTTLVTLDASRPAPDACRTK